MSVHKGKHVVGKLPPRVKALIEAMKVEEKLSDPLHNNPYETYEALANYQY